MTQENMPVEALNQIGAPGEAASVRMRESIATGRPANGEGNAQFEQEWMDINRRSTAFLSNEGMDTATFLAEQQRIDEDRRRFLERWRENQDLPTAQKQDVSFMSKDMAYRDESRDISRRYRENPRDPATVQAYQQRESELDGFMKAMVSDPEMGQYKSVQKFGELQQKLGDAKGDPEKERAIKSEMMVAARQYSQEIGQDPQFMEKAARFAERNRDNPVLQKTGLGEYTMQLSARRSRNNDNGLVSHEPIGQVGNPLIHDTPRIGAPDKSSASTVGDLISPDALQAIRTRARNAGLTAGIAVQGADAPSTTPTTANFKSNGVTLC